MVQVEPHDRRERRRDRHRDFGRRAQGRRDRDRHLAVGQRRAGLGQGTGRGQGRGGVEVVVGYLRCMRHRRRDRRGGRVQGRRGVRPCAAAVIDAADRRQAGRRRA